MDKFIVKKIKQLKRIRPDSSWVSTQKSFLLSEISQAPGEKRKPSLVLPVFNFNVLKILKPNFAIAFVIIILISSLGTVGVISAAQNSLPGDFLYPVKTVFEQAQLTFTPSQESKTKLSIKLATQRIDEFTQLVDKAENKGDIEKTVKKFTQQLVSVQENIDKLKEKNTDKAAEVAKLIKAQTPIYQETLIKNSEQLAYIIPEIDNALVEVNKTEKATEELTEEPAESQPEADNQAGEEEILVPAENVEEVVESASVQSKDLQEEFIPQEEEDN